ncbi:MAG: S49 family peptidase, partial [Candidatus Kapaibacterium sp.]
VESQEGDFKNNRVKGILLYMDTPGGYSTDSDTIYRLLMEYKKQYKVPIYAYVDGLCASGGMYIAITADKIMASDTSLIGSIGVIAPTFMNFTKPKGSKKGALVAVAAVGGAVAAGAALLSTKRGKALMASAKKKARKTSKSVKAEVSSLLRKEEKQLKRTARKIAPALKKAVRTARKRAAM